MSEVKWTPGPWAYEHNGYCGVITKNGSSIAAAFPQDMRGNDHDATANARLIAAAPDMYEALTEAALQIEYLHAKFQATGTGSTVLAQIHRARAKARGDAQ